MTKIKVLLSAVSGGKSERQTKDFILEITPEPVPATPGDVDFSARAEFPPDAVREMNHAEAPEYTHLPKL